MAGRNNVPLPPSSVTGELGTYLQAVSRYLNSQPTISIFTGANTPNSNLTGLAGDIAVCLQSGSTDTRMWLKGGSPTTPSKTGWTTLRTGPA
jgi:hypothetical protein